MNALLAMALIAVSVTALGAAFFLWTQTSPGRDVTDGTERSDEPVADAEGEEELDG